MSLAGASALAQAAAPSTAAATAAQAPTIGSVMMAMGEDAKRNQAPQVSPMASGLQSIVPGGFADQPYKRMSGFGI